MQPAVRQLPLCHPRCILRDRNHPKPMLRQLNRIGGIHQVLEQPQQLLECDSCIPQRRNSSSTLLAEKEREKEIAVLQS